jgi:hypothetical protein
MNVNKQLPVELWLDIIHILGKQGHLRDMQNLIKALKYTSTTEFDKYFVIELIKIRNTRSNGNTEYIKIMIDFWERTGIDDGVPAEYLLMNFNKKTKMYRTMWSNEIIKNDSGEFEIFKTDINNWSNEKEDIKSSCTYRIVKDSRSTPTCIYTKYPKFDFKKWGQNF